MARRLAWVGVLGLSACVTLPLDYSGADAGSVVVGFGVGSKQKAFDHYRIIVAREGDSKECLDGKSANLVNQTPHALLGSRYDYSNADEEGVVLVRSLPAGNYAICDYRLSYAGSSINHMVSPMRPIYLPFTVVAGQTLYMGNFHAHTVYGRAAAGDTREPGSVAFVVTDRVREDMAFTRAKHPGLPATVVDGTLDVKAHPAAGFWTPEMLAPGS